FALHIYFFCPFCDGFAHNGSPRSCNLRGRKLILDSISVQHLVNGRFYCTGLSSSKVFIRIFLEVHSYKVHELKPDFNIVKHYVDACPSSIWNILTSVPMFLNIVSVRSDLASVTKICPKLLPATIVINFCIRSSSNLSKISSKSKRGLNPLVLLIISN